MQPFFMDSDKKSDYSHSAMWEQLGITTQEWEQTPQSVRTVLISFQHQIQLLQIRCTGYGVAAADLLVPPQT